MESTIHGFVHQTELLGIKQAPPTNGRRTASNHDFNHTRLHIQLLIHPSTAASKTYVPPEPMYAVFTVYFNDAQFMRICDNTMPLSVSFVVQN